MKTWITKGGYKIVRLLSGRSNVFLISTDRINILVDTSTEFMWRFLQKRLERLQVKHIDLLILTHSHFDHTANAARIKDSFKPRIIIHQTEAKYLSAGDNIIPEGTNIFTKFIVSLIPKKFQSIGKYSACNCDQTVDDSFDLSGYGVKGNIMHTPGHTLGSISIIIDNEIALVGDTMFGIFWWSVFPPFASDQDKLLESWGKLLRTECELFLPSHGSGNKRSLVEKDYAKRNKTSVIEN